MASQTTKARPVKPGTRYKDDVFTWIWEQVALLRGGLTPRIVGRNTIDVAEQNFYRLLHTVRSAKNICV